MTRPMVTVGVPFLTACFAASFLSFENGLFLLALLAGILLAALFFAPKGKRAKFCVIFASAMAGVFCWQGGQLLHPYDFSQLDGKQVAVAGRVQSWERRENGRISCRLKVLQHTVADAPEEFTALLYLPGETNCEYGGWLIAEGKALNMSRTADIDMKLYYQNEGIDLLLSSYTEVTTSPPAALNLTEQLAAWNASLCDRVDRLLPADSAALVKALLLGNDRGISPQTEKRFQIAGVAHLFVVSGLHISLAAGLIYLFLKRLRLPLGACAAFACGAAWFFVLLTGAGIPAVRAGIMATLLLAGSLFHRPADGLNSLLLAGLLIVLFSPTAIVSGSFQLSFSATAGAILLAQPITAGLERLFHWKSRLFSLLGVSLGCTLAMLPAMLFLFGGVSVVSPLANLLAVPLLPVLLVLSALLLLPVPILGECMAALIRPLLSLLEGWCALLNRLPFAYLGMDYDYLRLYAVVVLVCLSAVWLMLHKRKYLMQAGGFFLCGALVLGTFYTVRNREVVTVAAVTSFESAAVVAVHGETADVLLLADDDYLGEAVLSYLQGKNVRQISSLILSAPNTDHVADEELLCTFLPVNNLILLPENELVPYAQGLLRPVNGVFLLEQDAGYDLTMLENGRIEIGRVRDGVRLLIRCGETTLSAGNSAELIAGDESEILFWDGKNLDFLRKTSPKYGILLSKPDEGENPLAGNWVSVWEQTVEVRIR